MMNLKHGFVAMKMNNIMIFYGGLTDSFRERKRGQKEDVCKCVCVCVSIRVCVCVFG